MKERVAYSLTKTGVMKERAARSLMNPRHMTERAARSLVKLRRARERAGGSAVKLDTVTERAAHPVVLPMIVRQRAARFFVRYGRGRAKRAHQRLGPTHSRTRDARAGALVMPERPRVDAHPGSRAQTLSREMGPEADPRAW